MKNQSGSPPPTKDFSHIPDTQLEETLNGAKRVRWCARASSFVLAVVCLIIGGNYWLTGAALGWLVVEINLGLLVRTLAGSNQWRGRSLKWTLIRFYLTFGGTILSCILVIRNNWGHPLAFLLGLISFFIGLVLALISLALKKPKSSPSSS